MKTEADVHKEYSAEIKSIGRIARRLRSKRPRVVADWHSPADWVVKYGFLDGRRATILSLTLTPSGCRWARAGGCTMCGEYEGSTTGDLLDPTFHISQFSNAVSILVRHYRPDWVRIYQEGSYLHGKEVSADAQGIIVSLASCLKDVKRITVESLARLVLPDTVERIRSVVDDGVELEIGVGLEAIDPIVRNVLVNKGESQESYANAVNTLRTVGAKSLAYVLLKPPFLTEAESVHEAVNTIGAARDMGFDAVTLEPMGLHQHSLVHALYTQGLYALPWLWSLRETAISARPPSDFRVGGGTGFYPRPFLLPQNLTADGEICGCSSRLRLALRRYAETQDVDVLRSVEACDCSGIWRQVMEVSDSTTYKDRIARDLATLDLNRYEESIGSDFEEFPRPTSLEGSLLNASGHDRRSIDYAY